MASKTANDIAALFFDPAKPSMDREDTVTHVTWRVWRWWLTAKQGNWLMDVARLGKGEYFNSGANGKPVARGSFKRDAVEYGWTANRVGANGNVMFEVITVIADRRAEVEAQRAYDAGYVGFVRYGLTVTPEEYRANDADYQRGCQQAQEEKYDYDSEASLRDAESGAAYERFLDNWAHSVESPFEAEREEAAIQDFERQLAACPDGIQPTSNPNVPF